MATTNEMIRPLTKSVVATSKQVSFITTLLSQRVLDKAEAAAYRAELPVLTKGQASSLIEFLLSKPKR